MSKKYSLIRATKRDLFRIVYPQSKIILARNVAKAAEAIMRVDLVCLVIVVWIGCLVFAVV